MIFVDCDILHYGLEGFDYIVSKISEAPVKEIYEPSLLESPLNAQIGEVVKRVEHSSFWIAIDEVQVGASSRVARISSEGRQREFEHLKEGLLVMKKKI